jgi:hypothetical protein
LYLLVRAVFSLPRVYRARKVEHLPRRVEVVLWLRVVAVFCTVLCIRGVVVRYVLQIDRRVLRLLRVTSEGEDRAVGRRRFCARLYSVTVLSTKVSRDAPGSSAPSSCLSLSFPSTPLCEIAFSSSALP